MDQRTYDILTASLFLIIAVLHLLRIIPAEPGAGQSLALDMAGLFAIIGGAVGFVLLPHGELTEAVAPLHAVQDPMAAVRTVVAGAGRAYDAAQFLATQSPTRLSLRERVDGGGIFTVHPR